MNITNTSDSAATSPTGAAWGLTIEKIMAVRRLLDQHERENRRRQLADMAGGLHNPFGGLRVVESPLAVQTVPVRAHKKRRNQTEAYHARVQKKWTKRFGTKQVACAYRIDGGQFGLGSYLVMPPGAMQKLRAAGVVL